MPTDLPTLQRSPMPRQRLSSTEFMEYRARPTPNYSALMLAARITLAHFSVSSAMSFPNPAGVSGSGTPPRSSSRCFILGSARAALISLLIISTMSDGVLLGEQLTDHPLHW